MLLKIKSITDVITNSSTEVYMIKFTDGVEDRLKALENIGYRVFRTEEDIKDHIVQCFREIQDGHWCYDLYDLFETEFFKENTKVKDVIDYTVLETILVESGKTAEEVFDFFSFMFKSLIGYCNISLCNHYITNDERDELDRLVKEDIAKKYYV